MIRPLIQKIICVSFTFLFGIIAISHSFLRLKSSPVYSAGTIPSASDDPTFVSLTFDDPNTYKGPIVYGWPPERSRDMNIYIRPGENTIVNDIECLVPRLRDVGLLVIVQSSPMALNRRTQARETYIKYEVEETRVKTVFLFGTDANQNTTQLDEEQDMFCDIVQMDFVDAYINATLDTVMAVKFAVEHYGVNKGWKEYLVETVGYRERHPKFLIIADDDSYINLKGMYRELFMSGKNGVLKESDRKMLGQSNENNEWTPVTFGDVNADRSVIPERDFYTMPKYMFNKLHVYPPWVGNGAYVIPFHNLECLYRESLKLPYLHMCDVFFTGFVRQMCNMTVLDDRRFTDVNFKRGILAVHKATNEEKLAMDQVLRLQNGDVELCGTGRICYKTDALHWCNTSSDDCEVLSVG